MDSIINKKNVSVSNENDEDLALGDWIPPDAELIQKMVSQIEYYLSDEHLVKDAFLLKHVRRNKLGYVNIKLLTSFKKMKQFTRDWRVTAHALRHSLTLEVNEQGNKVRRMKPVPESILFQVPSRLLLVCNVTESNLTKDMPNGMSPSHKSTLETAIAILEPFGTITMVRVNQPGRDLPPELQKYSYRYPELFTKESVLVEYEDLEGAGRAYHQLSQSEGNMRVLLVGKASKKKAVDVGSEDRSNGKGISILNQRMLQLQTCGEDSSACSSSESEFASSPSSIPRFFSSRGGCSPLSSPGSKPRCVRAAMPGPRISPLLASEVWGSPDTSPNLREKRKMFTKQNKHTHTRSLNGDAVPTGVLRLPYGPDGSKGFHAIIVRKNLHCSFKV
ncbi:la-related protein 6 [Silurus asotus]|uniref:La-related protein 6 n=1 Tax=Silurus asotus TaxID=30991 RepID=A0AAD5B716_SILAS|nr:la-related protein 6 [Silurus asotus]